MHRGILVSHPAMAMDSAEPQSGNVIGASLLGDGGSCLSYLPTEQVVWASVDGGIGLIISLRSEQEFARLSLIQDAVSREVVCPRTLLPHHEWRDYLCESQGMQPHRGFVDGDL